MRVFRNLIITAKKKWTRGIEAHFIFQHLKILIIQIAFIGDVILALPVLQKLKRKFPEAEIDFLLRKGNETLLENNPYVNEIIIWDKKKNKSPNLFRIISKVRGRKYDYVFNLHRFFSSGLVMALSGAKNRIGFDKNLLSFFYTRKFPHTFNGQHEVDRNISLLENITDIKRERPKLFFSNTIEEKIKSIVGQRKYIVIAPAAVWFTKQFPKERWVELLNQQFHQYRVYLIGSSEDFSFCEEIKNNSQYPDIISLCSKLSLTESACLMKYAERVFTNDSAPLHLASAVNAKVSSVFCSTIPDFGFFPLSDDSKVIQIKEKLYCRPCGVHGYKKCPEGHFRCAKEIDLKEFEFAM